MTKPSFLVTAPMTYMSEVIPISLTTHTALAAITIPDSTNSSIYSVIVTSDGKNAYVSSASDSPGTPGTTVTVNLKTKIVSNPISSLSELVAINPDGKTAYVTSSNVLRSMNLATHNMGASMPMPAGTYAWEVIFTS